VVACERCPRLRTYCARIAREKRRAYRDWDYWGRPVPGFGDPAARLLVVGLAPAAHGANRTGRMFTGDSSGDWLYAALHAVGFANQAVSVSRADGLALRGAYVGAAVRCAPPGNRPLPSELDACRPFLVREMEVLSNLRLVLALGGIAFRTVVRALIERGLPAPRPLPRFAHGALWSPGEGWPPVLASYHPSRQNTNTGRLTRAMWNGVFRRARGLVQD
jgi:uracil-DNA glycosylase family 4